jgi:hypothetical protein
MLQLRTAQWYQTDVLSASISFLETGRSHRVPNHGSTVGGNDSYFFFRQKLLGKDGSVRWSVIVKQVGLFSPKFGATYSQVFMQSPQNQEFSLAC